MDAAKTRSAVCLLQRKRLPVTFLDLDELDHLVDLFKASDLPIRIEDTWNEYASLDEVREAMSRSVLNFESGGSVVEGLY